MPTAKYFLLLASLACTGAFGMSLNKAFDEGRFQRISVGNDGQGEVRDFKIVYGDFVIPHGTNFEKIGPIHGVARSESQNISIPEVASVSWHSADGKFHEISVPIQNLIEDLPSFYGFKFYFVDDHLDVYLLSRAERIDPKFLRIVEKKVFSGP
jgi:hypothetical protein